MQAIVHIDEIAGGGNPEVSMIDYIVEEIRKYLLYLEELFCAPENAFIG